MTTCISIPDSMLVSLSGKLLGMTVKLVMDRSMQRVSSSFMLRSYFHVLSLEAKGYLVFDSEELIIHGQKGNQSKFWRTRLSSNSIV